MPQQPQQTADASSREVANGTVARQSLPAGHMLFLQGERGDRAYYIESGRLRVERNGDLLAELGPGAIVGELAADHAADATRTATVVSVTRCRLLSFSSAYVDAAMRRADPVLAALLRTLRARLRATLEAGPTAPGPTFPAAEADALCTRLHLERDLRTALADHQLELHAQPIVALPDGRAVWHELLLRWNHPNRGLLNPGAFLGLAEERGLMCELGSWTLRKAAQIAREGTDVSVNLSVQHLQSGRLAEEIREICTTTGIAPPRLQLELTETALVADPDAASAAIEALRALGCRVALDDFGSGYSAFTYLQRFPFDVLKLDKSLVDDLAVDARARSIVTALNGLARDLGLELVAEGVERPEQLQVLRVLGIGLAQGFHFGRPAPLNASA